MRAVPRFSGLILVLTILLSACTSTPSEPERVMVIDESLYEGVFLAPGADFTPYRRLMVPELEIESTLSVELGVPGYDPTGWGMTERDRRFYRQLYSELAVHQLVASGGYRMSIDPGRDVLLLVSRLTQVPPPPRSPESDVAQEVNTGFLTMNMELYDSNTGRLLGIITDRRPFGRSGEFNNRSVTYDQASQLFYYWMELLLMELEWLTKR